MAQEGARRTTRAAAGGAPTGIRCTLDGLTTLVVSRFILEVASLAAVVCGCLRSPAAAGLVVRRRRWTRSQKDGGTGDCGWRRRVRRSGAGREAEGSQDWAWSWPPGGGEAPTQGN